MFNKWVAILKNRLFLSCLGVFLFGATIGWSSFWKDDFLRIVSLHQQHKVETQKATVINRIANTEKKLAAFQAFFSRSNDASWLIETINHTADDCGVILSSVAPEYAPAGVDSYRRISLNIATKCTYHQLGVFVSKIESNPAFIKLSSVRINSSGADGSGRNVLDVQMTVSAYSLTGVI